MDRNEFELKFAQNDLEALDWFHRVGMFAIPCTCGANYCDGWIMQSVLNMVQEQIRSIPEEHLLKYVENFGREIHGVLNDEQ